MAAAAERHEARQPSLEEPSATATATPATASAALGLGPTAVGHSTVLGEGAGATGSAGGLSAEHGSRSAASAATAATPSTSAGPAQGAAHTRLEPGVDHAVSVGTAHANSLDARAGPVAAGRQTPPTAEPRDTAKHAAVSPTPQPSALTSCWRRTRRKPGSAAGNSGVIANGDIGPPPLVLAPGSGGGKGEERPGQAADIVLRIEAASPKETLAVNCLLLMAVALGVTLACLNRANPQRYGAVRRAHAWDGEEAAGGKEKELGLPQARGVSGPVLAQA